MSRCLMLSCVLFDKRECPNKEVNKIRGGAIDDEQPFHLMPSGQEQEDLDVICEFCPQGRFEMSENICPVCHEDFDFERDEPPTDNFGGEESYWLFKCPKGHRLYNKKDILG